MPKPNDDIQELKRRLLLLDRLEGPVLACAEGPYVLGAIEVTDADAIVAACRAGRPFLADLRAGLAVSPSPLLVTAALLATAQRDLRVLEGPRAASVLRSAGRIFRRHGDLDAAWIASKQARIDALADAARRASVLDAGGGAFAPWFERVLEIIAVARGEESAAYVRSLAAEVASDIAQSARKRGSRGRPSAHRPARGSGPRDGVERMLNLLAHAALWFEMRPRREGDSFDPTPEERTLDVPKLRALATRFKDHALRFYEAILLARQKLGSNEEGIAALVAKGLPIDKVERMVKLGRAGELLSVSSGAEGASAYAEWCTTLVPHYTKLGLDLPFTPELFDRMTTSRKSDLAVLAVCLLKHHSKADPDTAEQALARLDATLALFSHRPGDVASILGELTGTTPGAGRDVMPEIAAWLGDDALLDRYVHLSRIAGQPIPLSRTLRADFDRRETLSRERDHLASLASRSPVQQARLDRLLGGEVAIPTPDRTRRRITERIRELLAQAYEARLDAVLRRIARDAWGIQVPRLTPGWRDAIRFYLAVEDNRDLLATVLRTAASGADLARALPKNQAWIASASSRFNVGAWLAPRSRDVDIAGERHRLEIERDPIEVLRMGIPFDTCLSMEGGVNAASTVVNAADANKHVLYLRDARGRIVARKLLAVSRDHRLLGYHLYIAKTERTKEITAAFRDMCARISADTGLALTSHGTPKQIHPGFWYDDGPETFEGPVASEETDVAEYCQSLGLSVPSRPSDELREEARVHQLLRSERTDDLLAALAAGGSSMIAREAYTWLATRLDEDRLIAAARRDFHLAAEALRRAARRGYPALLDLAGRISGSEGAAELESLLRSFPPTLGLGLALLDAAGVSSRSGRKLCDAGLEHFTIDHLHEIACALPVSDGFVLCDRAAPLWQGYARKMPGCKDCTEYGEMQMAGSLVKAYLAAPDPAAVLARLSGRGSPMARLAAVWIAARFALEGPPDGAPPERLLSRIRPSPAAARALARLRRREPAMDRRVWMLAAVLRQTGGVARGVTLPVPSNSPFEALGDLLAQLEIPSCDGATPDAEPPLGRPRAPNAHRTHPSPDITPAVSRWASADADLTDWKPGAWELYYHRRASTPLRARLVEQATSAAFAPPAALDSAAEQAFHHLAQLGDVATLKRLLAAQGGTSADARRKRSILERATALAREIEGQMRSGASDDPLSAEAARRSKGRPRARTDEFDHSLSIAALTRLDGHLAEGAGEHTQADESLTLAFRLLLESDRFQGAATELIETLVLLRNGRFSPADLALIGAWLTARKELSRNDVPVPLAFHFLSIPSFRPQILSALTATGYRAVLEALDTLESLATASGTPHILDGLFEDLLGALFDRGWTNIQDVRREPQFRVAARLLVSRGVAASVVEVWKNLRDHRAIAILLEELEKSPLIDSPALRAQLGLWRERSPDDPRLEWLSSRVDSHPASRRPSAKTRAGEAPPSARRPGSSRKGGVACPRSRGRVKSSSSSTST